MLSQISHSVTNPNATDTTRNGGQSANGTESRYNTKKRRETSRNGTGDGDGDGDTTHTDRRVRVVDMPVEFSKFGRDRTPEGSDVARTKHGLKRAPAREGKQNVSRVFPQAAREHKRHNQRSMGEQRSETSITGSYGSLCTV